MLQRQNLPRGDSSPSSCRAAASHQLERHGQHPVWLRYCCLHTVNAKFDFATAAVQPHVQLETDTPEIVNECVKAVRKGGRISIIGAYGGALIA